MEEVAEPGHPVQVVRQELILPAEEAHPPLAVERTTLPEGPSLPPVLLVHGFAQNRFTWRVTGRSMSAFLAREGFDVYNLELRGHGRSRALGAGNATAFAEYVADARRVARALPDRPFVIGHSLGGAVGIGLATETDLRGLVHLAGIYTFAADNRTLRALARLTLAWEPALLAAPIRLHTGWTGDLISRLYQVTDIMGYGAPIAGWVPESLERELLEERLVRGFDWTSVEVWLQMSRWALGEELAWRNAFRNTDLPLLVVCGDADPLVTEVDAKRCYEESGSSDKEYVLFDAFEHGAHFGHVDLILGRRAPDVVWPVLRDWMVRRSS
ncbi:MAG: alpha/beta hydrolase [Alphaproteobacteria bacterium]|nr:alpha/beta hydrolase [Alphaproteobacteria bacterium]